LVSEIKVVLFRKLVVYKPDRMMRLRFAALLTAALTLVGCQTPVYQEQGWASYIADSYAGRMTSSGQVYYPNYYTAAQNTLPFGTELTVKNLYTGRSVKVLVTDRFPYYPGRVINLSSAAAGQIGMTPMQLAQVKVTAYKLPQQGYGTGAHAQQAGYYSQPAQQQTYQPPAQQQWQQPVQQSAPLIPSYSQPQAGAMYGPPPQAAFNQGAPTYQATQQAAKPSFFQRLRGVSTPSAPAYQGGGAPPAGLQTF
jgi:rare lipoprotein A